MARATRICKGADLRGQGHADWAYSYLSRFKHFGKSAWPVPRGLGECLKWHPNVFVTSTFFFIVSQLHLAFSNLCWAFFIAFMIGGWIEHKAEKR